VFKTSADLCTALLFCSGQPSSQCNVVQLHATSRTAKNLRQLFHPETAKPLLAEVGWMNPEHQRRLQVVRLLPKQW
jgi:hypothetical protein